MKSKNSVLRIARKYIDLGWCVVPIPAKEKAPRLKKWQKLRIKKSQVPENFEEGDNIGVLLGEPSSGLVDIDLDCPEALAFAHSLPKTDCVFGRKSNPRSHRFYYCDPPLAPEKFNDPDTDPENACLVEIRSTGQQTLVPPSIHPSGERVRWVEEGEPACVPPSQLRKAVKWLAAKALLARKWRKGTRNETALALAGVLLRGGWSEGETSEFIESIAQAAGDEQWRQRAAVVRATKEKLDKGEQVTGTPKLVKLLGQKSVNSICEWLGIGKRGGADSPTSVDQLLATADAKPEIHPSQAFHDGSLWYGLRLGKKKVVWVNNHGEFLTRKEMRARFSLPASPTLSRWSLRSVQKYRAGKTGRRGDALFLELQHFLVSHIRFVATWQPTVITLWLMGTYLHRVFDWYGYLWLTSPGRRTGKSKLLEIISAFAYNATSVMTDPTEASLFRETGINAMTQVLDEVESLRGADREKKASLMSLLNIGFKSGATIPRYNNDAKRTEYLDAYCPRVLAGISQLTTTLADRCIKIFLKRKLKEERVARFSERKLRGYLQHQRNLLYKFGLRYAFAVAKQYEAADTFPIPKTVDDRARDILEPLFAIAMVLNEQNPKLKILDQLTYAAERIAKDRAGDEGEDEETTATLRVLIHNFPKWTDHWAVTSAKALRLFSENDELEWVETRRQAARLLRQLGFKSKTQHVEKQFFRAYRIDKKKLEDLCARYAVAISELEKTVGVSGRRYDF